MLLKFSYVKNTEICASYGTTKDTRHKRHREVRDAPGRESVYRSVLYYKNKKLCTSLGTTRSQETSRSAGCARSRVGNVRSVLYYRVYIAGREVKLSIQDFHLYIQNMPCEHPFLRQLTRSNSGHTHIAPVATFFVY